ncbi:MAG: nicotinamide riboside transporter PnuC [Burkholderiaceae bacterium]
MTALLQLLQPLFGEAFTLWGAPVTRLELVAFALALAMVACNIRVNPWGWPLAIVSSLLYFGLFWNSLLYGDASLQIFFAAIAAWGWWQWLRGTQGDGSKLAVRKLGTRGRCIALIALAIAWPATGAFLASATDTDVPWWDAFPTAASVIGQWLLARKYVENWPTWLVVNVVSVALFAYKGLWLTVLLYAIFIVLSVVGWRAWMKLVAEGSPAAA